MPILSNAIRQRYRYTCLDQLASGEGAGQLAVQRFYQQGRLTNEVQGQNAWAILQVGDELLAQRNPALGTTSLLATDVQRSVSHVLGPTLSQARYTPYGQNPANSAAPCLLGFTGERAEPMTGHYLLGSYRGFNPLLMRFNSPDSFSPFG
ncbi:hypothetical protein DCO48_15335, partial [Pseudomonas sp. SDI]|uniref:RHS repeat-associated core domain-containing protein n=1 Tax=Pseudomonas sp. SDI TaxID=2170734 RepID=UPI000DE5D670